MGRGFFNFFSNQMIRWWSDIIHGCFASLILLVHVCGLKSRHPLIQVCTYLPMNIEIDHPITLHNTIVCETRYPYSTHLLRPTFTIFAPKKSRETTRSTLVRAINHRKKDIVLTKHLAITRSTLHIVVKRYIDLQSIVELQLTRIPRQPNNQECPANQTKYVHIATSNPPVLNTINYQ